MAARVRAELVATIGVDPRETTRVYLAAADDFQALQPGGRRLPSWVAGVAYGDLNTIILRQAGSRGQPIALEQTFVHEMSHIILRQATDAGAEMPRWFVEGLAQWQAREFDLERVLRLSKAMLSGRWIPLAELTRRWPADPAHVPIAYDESFEVINFLIGEYGLDPFHALIKRLGAGEPFAEALQRVYALTLPELETRWLAGMKLALQLDSADYLRRHRVERGLGAVYSGAISNGGARSGVAWRFGRRRSNGWMR